MILAPPTHIRAFYQLDCYFVVGQTPAQIAAWDAQNAAVNKTFQQLAARLKFLETALPPSERGDKPRLFHDTQATAAGQLTADSIQLQHNWDLGVPLKPPAPGTSGMAIFINAYRRTDPYERQDPYTLVNGPVAWDGKSERRRYAFDHNEFGWRFQTTVRGNRPDLIKKVNAIIDEEFSKLSALLAERPATSPATAPSTSAPAAAPADAGEGALAPYGVRTMATSYWTISYVTNKADALGVTPTDINAALKAAGAYQRPLLTAEQMRQITITANGKTIHLGDFATVGITPLQPAVFYAAPATSPATPPATAPATAPATLHGITTLTVHNGNIRFTTDDGRTLEADIVKFTPAATHPRTFTATTANAPATTFSGTITIDAHNGNVRITAADGTTLEAQLIKLSDALKSPQTLPATTQPAPATLPTPSPTTTRPLASAKSTEEIRMLLQRASALLCRQGQRTPRGRAASRKVPV